jgi:type I restriction enzyme S subunit
MLKDWVEVELGDVCDVNPKKPIVDDECEVSFIPMAQVEEETGIYHLKETRKYKDVKKGYQGFIEGDLLFAKITPCMENGKIAVINKLINSIGFGSTEFHVLRANDIIAKEYLFCFLIQGKFKSIARQNMTGSAGQLRVPKAFLETAKFPLAPLPEQRAIAAKIEQLFSELDNGIANLKTAQSKLEIYRQAILKQAFEGELTKEWREKQDDLPTSEELLSNIKQEQDWFYEKQLIEFQIAISQWEKNGKVGDRPTKPTKRKQLPDILDDELNSLTRLADGMAWIRLGDIVWSVKDGPHYSPKYSEKGIPFISGGNIRPNGINFSNAKFISQELHLELSKRCKPELNDVLYTKGGTTGIARVNTYDFDFNVWVHVAVLKPLSSIYPFYLQYVLNSNHCYKQSQKYTHGVGNQDLGLTRMVLITLPICSLQEQTQIVQEIETRLSVCDKLNEAIEQSLEKAQALRQSILKKAFEGKLLSQDELQTCRQQPDWETAAKLLERVKNKKNK